MLGIDNKPYVNLDQFLDIDSLNQLEDDIILGIAKTRATAGPTNSGPGYVDRSKQSVPEIYRHIMSTPNHPYHNLLKSLKNWEPQTFIQYKWPSHVLGSCILLRIGDSYTTKHLNSNSRDLPAIKHFDSLINWIKSQNIFEEMGRIVIFLNDPFGKTIEHSDYIDVSENKKDNFIWLNPLRRKKFFIKDQDTKHYIESTSAFFNSSDVHGSDPSDTSTFSIRFDGVFKKEFIQKIGLERYFNE